MVGRNDGAQERKISILDPRYVLVWIAQASNLFSHEVSVSATILTCCTKLQLPLVVL